MATTTQKEEAKLGQRPSESDARRDKEDDLVPEYIVRAGTFYLTVPASDPDDSVDLELASRLGEALEDDARVTSVEVPEMDPAWTSTFSIYPGVESVHDDRGVLSGQRHLHYQRFSAPIAFEVHVPKKNQPTTHADDIIPTENYFALWNGQTLMVSWEFDREVAGWGGGHVIADIIEQAAKKSGAGVHVQACDPYCEHMFAHTDILLALTADGPRWHVVRRRGPTMAVFARGRAAKSVKEAANVAWRWCRVPFRDFADVKNLGLRILDVERRLR